MEGVLWIVRTGSWRDLPDAFGEEKRVPALQSMEQQGCLVADFLGAVRDPDFEYLIVDSTIVRAISSPPAPKRGV